MGRGTKKLEGKSMTARERFEKLSVSRRSTFAALNNALLYTIMTETSWREFHRWCVPAAENIFW